MTGPIRRTGVQLAKKVGAIITEAPKNAPKVGGKAPRPPSNSGSSGKSTQSDGRTYTNSSGRSEEQERVEEVCQRQQAKSQQTSSPGIRCPGKFRPEEAEKIMQSGVMLLSEQFSRPSSKSSNESSSSLEREPREEVIQRDFDRDTATWENFRKRTHQARQERRPELQRQVNEAMHRHAGQLPEEYFQNHLKKAVRECASNLTFALLSEGKEEAVEVFKEVLHDAGVKVVEDTTKDLLLQQLIRTFPEFVQECNVQYHEAGQYLRDLRSEAEKQNVPKVVQIVLKVAEKFIDSEDMNGGGRRVVNLTYKALIYGMGVAYAIMTKKIDEKKTNSESDGKKPGSLEVELHDSAWDLNSVRDNELTGLSDEMIFRHESPPQPENSLAANYYQGTDQTQKGETVSPNDKHIEEIKKEYFGTSETDEKGSIIFRPFVLSRDDETNLEELYKRFPIHLSPEQRRRRNWMLGIMAVVASAFVIFSPKG